MAVTWGNRPSGMTRRSSQSVTLPYVLTGVINDSFAYSLAVAYSSAMYDGLYRSDVALTHMGVDIYNVDVTYGPIDKKQPEPGDFKWNFDTTGATKHLTQSLSHVASFVPDGKAAVDHKGAIGVTEDGEIAGCDVRDRSFKWSEIRQLVLANYGWTYTAILEALTGSVNDATFRGKEAKCVIFDGATGGQSQKDPLILEVTYNFIYNRPLSGLTVGDITNVAAAGWEYLWVEYKTDDGGTGNRLARRPVQANVEKVCELADFSLLGIGTAAL